MPSFERLKSSGLPKSAKSSMQMQHVISCKKAAGSLGGSASGFSDAQNNMKSKAKIRQISAAKRRAAEIRWGKRRAAQT